MSAPVQQLQRALGDVSWNITHDADLNIEGISDLRGQEQLNSLLTPIPGLYRVVIYYPVMAGPGHGDEYYHRVEYATPTPITPLQVLISISEFYRQPFTRANYDAIVQLKGKRYRPWFQPWTGMTIGDTLGDHVFFEGLTRYDDGFAIRLGS